VPADEHGWLEATFRLESIEGAVGDVLSLGPEIEVLAPPGLRHELSRRVDAMGKLYDQPV
jgi:predicted DNA-binding transcriptional regulator YafY